MAVVRAPNRYQPPPQSYHAAITAHTDSFKLSLQQVLPPGKQLCMDVPPAPRRAISLLTHIDSFKLPLQQVLPAGQREQTLPPISQRRNLADWQEYILPWAQPPPPPFTQTNWPNPTLAKPPVVKDWSQSPSIALTFVQPPFFQTDWPLPPKAKTGVPQMWSDSFKLPLQQVLPPRQLDWPVPRGSISYILRGFALRNILTTGTNPLPYNNHDWPNPRGPQQPVITSRDFVAGSRPPVPPTFDPSHTLKNEIRRVRYLDNGTGRVRFLKNQVRS